MTILQKRIAFLGLSKQTAKGTAATTPATFGLGIRSGSILRVDIEQEDDQISFASRVSADENRTGIMPGVGMATRAWPRSVGLLLYGALGGITSTPGTPNTHVIVPGADVPYLTAFTQLDTEYHKVADCKVDTLTLSWDGRSAPEVELVLNGITWTGYTAAWTSTNDETGQTKFIPPGGLFKVDASSGTPATAPIIGGRISINNNLKPVPLSASVVPDDQAVAVQEIEYEFTLAPADTTEWRKIVTGTAAGTTPTGNPIYGSAQTKFVNDVNNDLDLTATRVAFLAEYPEMDPAGGFAELKLSGRVKKPAGAALTATLHNAIAAY